MLIVHKLSFTHYTLLAIHDTSHFSWETLPCVMMPTNTNDVMRITRQMILLLLVCVSFTIMGQPRNSVLIRRV